MISSLVPVALFAAFGAWLIWALIKNDGQLWTAKVTLKRWQWLAL